MHSLFALSPMIIQENVSLKPYNTFGIDAKARYFTEVRSISDLQQLLASPTYGPMKKLILGGGSNLLLTGDFDGLVVRIDLQGIEQVRQDADHAWIKAGAGVNWH